MSALLPPIGLIVILFAFGASQQPRADGDVAETPLDDVTMDDGPCTEGQTVQHGCEQICTCTDGKSICVERCRYPLVNAMDGRQLDPDCKLTPTPDKCCSALVCAQSVTPGNGDAGCVYKNLTYKSGETFNDSCTAICHCEEDGHVSCKPRCAPSNMTGPSDQCLTLKDSNDPCCTVLYCDVNANDENGPQENSMQRIKLISAFPANSSVAMLNFEKGLEVHKLTAEISFDKMMWTAAKLHDHQVEDLLPGKTYYIRVMSDGLYSNIVPITLPNMIMNSSVCEYKGKSYKRGDEFHDDCVAYCVCEKNGVGCATIECPTDFGLDVLDPQCLDWDTQPVDFIPTPPNCCPETVTCKDNGSCIYNGERFDNWAYIPDKLTGCEQKCYCEKGNITCQPRCSPVPAKPPHDMKCPQSMAILSHTPEDECCLAWTCSPHLGGDVNSTFINIRQNPVDDGQLFPILPLHKHSPETEIKSDHQSNKETNIPGPVTVHDSLSDKQRSVNVTNNDSMTGLMQDNEQFFGPYAPVPENNSQSDIKKEYVMSAQEGGSSVKMNSQGVIENNIVQKNERTINSSTISSVLNSPQDNTYKVNYSDHGNMKHDIPAVFKNKNSSTMLMPNDSNYHNIIPAVHSNQNPFLHQISQQQNVIQNINFGNNMLKSPNYQAESDQYSSNYQAPSNKQVIPVHNGHQSHYGNVIISENKNFPNPDLFLHHVNYPGGNQPDILHLVPQTQFSGSHNRIPPPYVNREHVYTYENHAGPPIIAKQSEPFYSSSLADSNLKKGTIHIHSPTVPTGLRLEDIIEQIRHHEATNLQTKDDHVVQLGAQPQYLAQGVTQQHLIPGFPVHPHDQNGITVHTLEAVDEHTVRLVLSVPRVFVGLLGRVELRYTSDTKNSDPSTWEQQDLAPPNDLIATSQLEFELGNLKPNTEYKIKVSVVMRGLHNSPASEILTVKTPGPGIQTMPLPSVIPVEADLRVEQLNSTWVTLIWRKFTDFEHQFIDGVQLRYKELDGKVYQATPLIHRAVTSYTIDDLKPESHYEVGIFFIPFPGQTTELQSHKTLQISTTMENDPYKFDLTVDVFNIKSTSVEVKWIGIPYPEDKYVNIFRVIYQNEGGREDTNTFKVAKRDSPANTLIQGLKPDNRYHLWLEAYLTNGKIKKSNVQDFTTKRGLSSPDDIRQAKSEGTPIQQETDYYGSLVGVSILAAIAILAALGLLYLLVHKRGHNKAPITAAVPRKPGPHTTAYDNPSYKTYEGDITNGRTAVAVEES